MPESIDKAVDTCIENNILADFLRGHRAEVKDMLFKEYNEALHIANEKEISYEAGKEEQRKINEKEIQDITTKLNQAVSDVEQERRNTELERRNAEQEKRRANVLFYKIQGKSEREFQVLCKQKKLI